MGLRRWRTVRSVTEQSSGIFSFRRNASVSPRDGRLYEFVVLDTPDWVSVVPITATGELVMVRQYRHGVDDFTLEVPGGVIEAGQSPEEGGRAELAQETGFTGGEWSLLGVVSALPSVLANHLHVYLARDVERLEQQNLDITEDIQVELVPMRYLRRMIAAGEIMNAPVIAALYLFDLWQQREADAPLGA